MGSANETTKDKVLDRKHFEDKLKKAYWDGWFIGIIVGSLMASLMWVLLGPHQ